MISKTSPSVYCFKVLLGSLLFPLHAASAALKLVDVDNDKGMRKSTPEYWDKSLLARSFIFVK